MLTKYTLAKPLEAAQVHVFVNGRTLFLTSARLTDADVDVLVQTGYRKYFKKLKAALKPI